MEIKGVNDSFKNDLKIKETAKKEQPVSAPAETEAAPAEAPKIEYQQSDAKVRKFMDEMKNYQESVSRGQSYLDNLMKAKKELSSNKSVEQIYVEMMELAKRAHFNNKPLLSAVLPENIDFYKKYDNIKTLANKVDAEIEKTRHDIVQQQQQISRYSITIENIKASLSHQELNQMQKLLADNMLYKNVNSDMVASLIANK